MPGTEQSTLLMMPTGPTAVYKSKQLHPGREDLPLNVIRDLEPIERAGEDELRTLQLERLKWSLRHAYENVAHYRASFAAHDVHPEDLRTLSDLHRFPFLAKADFRTHYPFGLFAVPRR